ncbi:hypothetical protein F2Q70_00029630 [Brassica cretica]|uniref:Uncharacterized protein n=1 Tax=Brassica cretica TaxID=69181 RepID=A0A8S9FH56_BRACR|nr:hypothetical protein F2Q70_00029630 [Brassica cretica]
MSISTRSSKEKELFFSDPTRLERSIRKEKCTALFDTNSSSLIDTCEGATIDTSTRASFDTIPRADNMVAALVLIRDRNGGLHDPEGHLCNAACQKINGHGDEPSVATEDAKVLRQRTIAEWIRHKKFLFFRYMSISTRSSKEKELFFSDPTRLERSIRKEKCTALFDTNSSSLIDTCEGATVDTSTRASFDTIPRVDNMVAALVLIRDRNGDLHDPEGHLCNAAGQKINGHGDVIHEPSVATEDAKVLRQRTIAEWIRHRCAAKEVYNLSPRSEFNVTQS